MLWADIVLRQRRPPLNYTEHQIYQLTGNVLMFPSTDSTQLGSVLINIWAEGRN